MKKWFTNIYYSFPCRLLILHLRSNLVLLAIWIFLVLFLTGSLAEKFGIRYLFLSPEYMGKVGFWSFFYLGLAFGGFAMSWNLTSYLLSAHYFPFLATLARPFTKFSLNNVLIPVAYVLLFLISTIWFDVYYEFHSLSSALWNGAGFMAGIVVLVTCISSYFFFTNKDILSFLNYKNYTSSNFEGYAKQSKKDLPAMEEIKSNKNQMRVDTYLTESFRPRLVRSVAHYDPALLLRVFKQNHTNALIVQLSSLVVLFILGLLIDHPRFRIPAGASMFLLSSIIVAITGAISYWFNRWRMTVLILLFIAINQITRYDVFNHKNKAYGLDYSAEPSPYTYQQLEGVCTGDNVNSDIKNTRQILDNWSRKLKTPKGSKPKMVFYCASGGGMKSALWAMEVLQKANRLSNGRLMRHTVLMSGASGGMIGSAYFRELYLRKQQNDAIDLNDDTYIQNIGKDLLNSIAFTIVTNDLFVPWAQFKKGGFSYKKDRGYIFEKQLDENTNFVMDKTIMDYHDPEFQANIPLIFITPSIVTDGRRLIISSQGVSYMMAAPIGIEIPGSVEIDAVDFRRFFDLQGADSLQFTTALRMNATYPYILPNIYLPSKPHIEVMDSGFRDNFGLKSAIRFIHVFQKWIKENTSGVILVQVRGYDRNKEIESTDNQGVFDAILNPLGLAGKILSLQDYEHDTNLGFVFDILGKENFEIIHFTYYSKGAKRAPSMSFHLTKREKREILEAIDLKENQESLKRLTEALSTKVE